MLFNLKEMEDQQAEMIQLYETAALEKGAAARIQTRLLKQVDALRKSQSSRSVEGRVRTPHHPKHNQESAHSIDNSKRDRSETLDDDERSEDSGRPQSPKFPHIKDITNLVQKRLNQTGKQFSKEMECSGLRPSDSPLSNEITIFCFSRNFVMPTFDHYSGTFDPLLHLRQFQNKMAVYTNDDLLLCRAFPSSLKGAAYH